MLRVNYRKLVPYPFEVVLSQYYDYEHIEQVHPETLGRYVLVEQDGDRVVYDQIWPRRFGRRPTSRVEQTFSPPNEIWFRFLAGLHRGIEVRTVLEASPDGKSGGGTLVDETYLLPWLPDWPWLRRLALPAIRKRVDEVWDEDLEVEVCHGGWPGLPPSYVPMGSAAAGSGDRISVGTIVGDQATDGAESWLGVCLDTALPTDGSGARFTVAGVEVALFRDDDGVRCLANRCPHTGGPLALGRLCDGAVTCPWHGARFSVEDGRCQSGPGGEGVEVFAARARAGRIEIELPHRIAALRREREPAETR